MGNILDFVEQEAVKPSYNLCFGEEGNNAKKFGMVDLHLW